MLTTLWTRLVTIGITVFFVAFYVVALWFLSIPSAGVLHTSVASFAVSVAFLFVAFGPYTTELGVWEAAVFCDKDRAKDAVRLQVFGEAGRGETRGC